MVDEISLLNVTVLMFLVNLLFIYSKLLLCVRFSYLSVSFCQVELEDRSILPGDVVRWRNKGNGGKKAQIVDVRVMVDVKIIGMNFILSNLNAQKCLKPVNSEYL